MPSADPAPAANREPVPLAVRLVGQQLQAEAAGHRRALDPVAPSNPDRSFGVEEGRASVPQQLGGLWREYCFWNRIASSTESNPPMGGSLADATAGPTSAAATTTAANFMPRPDSWSSRSTTLSRTAASWPLRVSSTVTEFSSAESVAREPIRRPLLGVTIVQPDEPLGVRLHEHLRAKREIHGHARRELVDRCPLVLSQVATSPETLRRPRHKNNSCTVPDAPRTIRAIVDATEAAGPRASSQRWTTTTPKASGGEVRQWRRSRFSPRMRSSPWPSARRSLRTAMKEGLLGGRLGLVIEERARGGPFSCCTLDWI